MEDENISGEENDELGKAVPPHMGAMSPLPVSTSLFSSVSSSVSSCLASVGEQAKMCENSSLTMCENDKVRENMSSVVWEKRPSPTPFTFLPHFLILTHFFFSVLTHSSILTHSSVLTQMPTKFDWERTFANMTSRHQPKTKTKYTTHFKNMIKALQEQNLYNVHPQNIDFHQLTGLVAQMVTNSSTDGVAHSRVGFLSGFWNFLYISRVVKDDFKKMIDHLKPKQPKSTQAEDKRSLTQEDCRLLTKAAMKAGTFDLALLTCLYYAGQRCFETTKLHANDCTWKCVNPHDKLNDPNSEKYIEFKIKGKGAKWRITPMSPEASKNLRSILADALSPEGQAKGGWLFPSKLKKCYGSHISDETTRRHIIKLGREALLEDENGVVIVPHCSLEDKYGEPITPHWLRYGYISHSMHNGADIATVARHVGHGNIKTTSGYANANKDVKKSASNYLTTYNETDTKEKKMTREELKQVYKDLKRTGASEDELQRAKEQYKAILK